MKNRFRKKAFSLIEIILGVTIFAIFSISLMGLTVETTTRDVSTSLKEEALFYAQEGLESTRNIRDIAYLSLTNGDHGLLFASGSWNFAAAPEDIDGFYSRTITVEDVYRDGTGSIAEDGTFFDPDTKKVSSEIEWIENGIIPKSVILEAYLSNWRGDDWIQTTCAEFDLGTYEDTITEGLVAPPVDNCGIKLSEIEEVSEFFSSVDLGKHGTDVDVDGNYAYMTVNSYSKGFSVIDVSDPENPFLADDLDVESKGRSVTKSGNYAYIGVRSNSDSVAIINVSNPSSVYIESQIGLGGYGNSTAVDGNNLFLGVNKSRYSFLSYDVTSKASPSYMDDLDFHDEVQAIALDGNYAYVGLDDDHEALRIADVSDVNDMQKISSLDVDEEINAIEILGTIAYLGIEEDDDSLIVVDISDPYDPEIITTVEIDDGEIVALAISGDYLYAAVDETHAGLAVFNISNPFAPEYVYSLNVGGKGTGIDADGNYVYITTNTSNKGLVIIGTTVAGIVMSGSYISGVLDTGSVDAIYNFIEWTHTEVPGSSLKFQIRTADSAGNLSSANWVGSDGTNATYYENSRTQIVLDPSRSGSRYCQFKAIIESDGVSTPIIESVRINYSP